MSTKLLDYDTFILSKGCPPEHVSILGEPNEEGLVLDVHRLATSQEGWEGIHNNDLTILSQRLVTLEQKTGELGYDSSTSTYTLLPKTSVIPSYSESVPTSTITIRSGGSDINSNLVSLLNVAPGYSHAKAIAHLDRSIQILEKRVGNVTQLPTSPPTSLNTFSNTVSFGTTSSSVEEVISVPASSYSPAIPAIPAIPGTPRPFHYADTSTLAEAIASIDDKAKTHLTSIDSQLSSIDSKIDNLRSSLDNVYQFTVDNKDDIAELNTAMSTLSDNYVDLTTSQTIAGDKLFSNRTHFTNGIRLVASGNVNKWTVSLDGSDNLVFSNASGTTAMYITQSGDLHAKRFIVI